MPSDKPVLRFEEILDNIRRIETYTDGLSFEQFEANEQCQDAVAHCLLRISEAARKLEGLADSIAPTLPWPSIRAIGNVLRHQYDEVNSTVIWQIVTDHLQPLQDGVARALETLETLRRRPER